MLLPLRAERPAAGRQVRVAEPHHFDGRRAYRFLNDLCLFGPRPSGSAAMAKQRVWLTQYFSQLGARVVPQSFIVRHPDTGQQVTLSNLIVQWHPERPERVLLCTHYDTRPYPDRDPDPNGRRGVFVGANDGASGVAVLCELANFMPDLPGPLGVDFVLFDAEEFVFDDRRDKYFRGSDYFARQYAAGTLAYTYRYAVLLDMVGDAELQIYQERYSVQYALPVVRSIWRVARELGSGQFVARVRHRLLDDHVPLIEIAKIPTCCLVDFDYPGSGSPNSYWHTREDTPDKCSAESLAVVGRIVLAWLRQQR